ncbi:uncharacterized protein LOC126834328 isoform X3 [Adelges cooleyi]|uniref:uncharacterized protein LOC126834328 isoform X3 n=1 Tax=Adelges cooleyi TaxID=133065 RepID=UPI00217F5AA5|nr:uncharacterized protein LOC126834328 isoform X3 [Adelges cooleyi]
MELCETMKEQFFNESEKNPKFGDNFGGFDIDDDTLAILVNKKKSIKMELNKVTGEPMEVDKEPNSPPHVNNNNIHQNNKPKSNVSSPETSDAKQTRNGNKRLKRDLSRTEAIENLETNELQPGLELTTPTFNLTSSAPRSRKSVGRKMNVDISDPIYKLPFDFGWKRELVYRTTGDSASNKSNRSGDVYYYSPTNKKLRSLREIQEQLDLSNDGLLSIESFTFLKQPLGLDDRTKEIIREANTKLSKEDSFTGTGSKSKKVKTPIRQPIVDNIRELSDDENEKTSTKMKVVFKNVKGSKSKSKKEKESLNTSLSTPEYIAEDWQAIQSSATTTSPTKSNDAETSNSTSNKRRFSEINGSLLESPVPIASMQSFNYMATAMRNVFKYLKVQELLSASRVCPAWNMIAMNRMLWQNIRLKNSQVRDWEKFADTINRQGTEVLDTRRMLIPSKLDDFDSFWLCFSAAIKKAKNLKNIELYRCPTHVVEDTIYALPQLVILNATSIKNPLLTKEAKNCAEFMPLNLKYLGQMTNLTEIRIKSFNGIKLTSLASLDKLVHLKTLSLTSIKNFPKDICKSLDTVTVDLEFLEIGDCDCLSNEFAVSLRRFVNLRSLRLENCCGRWDSYVQSVFSAIRSLDKLSILELINVEFSNTVEDELEKCDGIRALLIIPAYISQSATTNCHLIDCLKKLSGTLTHVVWGLTHELLRVTDLFITQYQQNQHTIGYNLELSHTKETSNNIPILRTRKKKDQSGEATSDKDEKQDSVDILSVPALETLLETMMIGAKTKVIKVPFSATNRVYLAEQFNDL